MFVEHALSHMIAVGAAFQFHAWFDADFFREGIVDRGLRSLVALPGPVVHVDARSFPGGALRMKPLVQLIGVPERIGDFHVAFHDLRVPDLMKVGRVIFTFRMARCSSIARVTHPSGLQYPSSSRLCFPRGISM